MPGGRQTFEGDGILPVGQRAARLLPERWPAARRALVGVQKPVQGHQRTHLSSPARHVDGTRGNSRPESVLATHRIPGALSASGSADQFCSVGEYQPCVQSTSASPASKSKYRDASCRAVTKLSRRQIGFGLQGIAGRKRPPLTLHQSHTETNAQQNAGSAVSSSRRSRLSRLFLASCLIAVSSPAFAESGIASIYGNGDGHEWTKTANGELVNPRAMTAAHKTRKLGSFVQVLNRQNGKTVTVRLNDRGPFIAGRIIDLTPAAASALGCDGLCEVTLQ